MRYFIPTAPFLCRLKSDLVIILKRNNNQFSLEAKKLLDLFSKDVIIDQYINFYKKILKDGENYEK